LLEVLNAKPAKAAGTTWMSCWKDVQPLVASATVKVWPPADFSVTSKVFEPASAAVNV